MLSDLEAAEFLLDLYAPSPAANWDMVDEVDGVFLGIKKFNDETLVALRGSQNLLDWFRDMLAIWLPQNHTGLGPIHQGFSIGMTTVSRLILDTVKGPVRIAGHSLGGGRAPILAGHMVLGGRPPLKVISFGQPAPGFDQLAQVIAGVPQVSYRNGDDMSHDKVTDVPYHIPILAPYVHPAPFTLVDGGYSGSGRGLFDHHHMPLYLTALRSAIVGGKE